MNENEFDRTARAWLEDGPTRMSDRAVLSTLEKVHTTRQRRTPWTAWRARPVSLFARSAGAAALVAVIGIAAVIVIPRLPGVGGPEPSQATGIPALTTLFISPRNGFSIKHPEAVTPTPAVQVWGFSEQVDDGFDAVEVVVGAVLKGASTMGGITGDDSIDQEVDEWLSDARVLPDGCGVPRSRQAELTIDGQSGRIAECEGRIEATVVVAGRLYLFTLLHGQLGGDARVLFDALVATIDLTPATAVDEIAWTRTFASPTYGYSFMQGRGGFQPATEPWDPVDPRIDDWDLRFDGFETGAGAYLEAASATIPDGVSVDAWVDEYIVPAAAGGCGVPRSAQEEIVIDGRSGRVARCGHSEATVVAGGRLYLFIGPSDSRNWFDRWIATIHLTPETAVAPSSTPSGAP